MAVIVSMKNPEFLMIRIKNKIEKDEIRTWRIDKDGDLTHLAEQWAGEAWFHPHVYSSENKIIFSIIGRKDRNMTKEVYAVYHANLVQLLLGHFDKDCDDIQVTAMPHALDRVSVPQYK